MSLFIHIDNDQNSHEKKYTLLLYFMDISFDLLISTLPRLLVQPLFSRLHL